MKTITNPVEALVSVGRENTEMREELQRLQAEHYHFMTCLRHISEMPNAAAPVAALGLQLRPFK